MILEKVKNIWILALMLVSSCVLVAQSNADNTIIVSGFVLNSTTQEGVTANITIKNAETFRVVTVIPTSNLSGSYTFKLVRARYYFVVETPGFELFSVLVDLNGVDEKRIQRNLILLPVGAKKSGYVPILDINGKDASFDATNAEISSESINDNNTPDFEDEMGWDDTNPEVKAAQNKENNTSAKQNQSKDKIEVEIVKGEERRVENGKVVYTGVPVSSNGRIIKEQAEDIQNSKGTSNIRDIEEGRESEINFNIKGGAQFIDVPMYFNKNDANTATVVEQMNLVLTFLRQNSSISLEIRGYSEDGFLNAMQKQFALQRAINVKRFLIENGISSNRLTCIAYPTNDYELVVERKRNYRKQHLVEFRIIGDTNFEEAFKARFEEDYAQYKQGDVPTFETADNNDISSQSDDLEISSNSQIDSEVEGLPGNISKGYNDGYKEQNVSNDKEDQDVALSSADNSEIESSVSSIDNQNTSDDSLTTNTDSILDNRSTLSEAEIGNTEISNNSVDANSDNKAQALNRKDISGISIDGESADYSIGYDGYRPDEDTVVTQEVFNALDRINASADRINNVRIMFEAKLAEVDEFKYKNVFDSIYIFMMNNRRWTLDIYGYASKKGDKKEASVIHKYRAQNIYHVLVDKGIDKTRIKFKGKGLSLSKDENGEKIPLNNQMYAEFNLKKPNLSGFNDNIKVDKTAKRSVSSKGKDMKGKDNFSGAKTNYDESNGFDELRTKDIPVFKTELEYIEYLKTNQGSISLPGLFFRVQLGAFNLPLDSKNKLFKIKNVELLEGKDGMYRYVTEKYTGINDAYNALKKVKRKVDDAFVLAFYNNQKITMKEATEMLLNKK